MGEMKERRRYKKLKYRQYLHCHFMTAMVYILTFSCALNLNLHHCFGFSCDIKKVLVKCN